MPCWWSTVNIRTYISSQGMCEWSVRSMWRIILRQLACKNDVSRGLNRSDHIIMRGELNSEMIYCRRKSESKEKAILIIINMSAIWRRLPRRMVHFAFVDTFWCRVCRQRASQAIWEWKWHSQCDSFINQWEVKWLNFPVKIFIYDLFEWILWICDGAA